MSNSGKIVIMRHWLESIRQLSTMVENSLNEMEEVSDEDVEKFKKKM